MRRWTKATRKAETLATGFITPSEADVNLARLHKIALTASYVFWSTASDLRRVDK